MNMESYYYIVVWIFTGVILTVVFYKYFSRLKLKRRLLKAKKSEVKALDLLYRHGYQVLDIQKDAFYTLYVDNKPFKACVKADVIVKKANKTYVAEVKSGKKAPSPTLPATRRQLLEYFMAYKPDGLLLVDMEKEKIRKIEYPISKNNKSILFKQISWISLTFIIGFIVGFLTRGD